MSALLAALLLTSCKPVPPPPPDVVDAGALFARALAEPASSPMYATFDAVVTTGGRRISAAGTLVVSPPDRFRVELRGPIGPPQVVVTCDGHDVRAYMAPKNTFYAVNDADGALGALLGAGEGLRGAAVATSLLMGRLPLLPAEPVLVAVGPLANATWTRADNASFTLGIDGRTAHLADARATDPKGVVLFTGAWEPDVWPKALSLALPTLDTQADVRFGTWNVASLMDAAFVLEQPPGSEVGELNLVPQGAATP